MALIHTVTYSMKEFDNVETGVCVRLMKGFDKGEPSYYAVDVKTGLNLPFMDKEHGVIKSQVMSATDENLAYCKKQFAKLVKAML